MANWRRATTDIARHAGARAGGPQGAASFDMAAFEAKWCANGVFARVAHRAGLSHAVAFRLEPPSGGLT